VEVGLHRPLTYTEFPSDVGVAPALLHGEDYFFFPSGKAFDERNRAAPLRDHIVANNQFPRYGPEHRVFQGGKPFRLGKVAPGSHT
jgi:hypothetical protein